MLKKILMTTVVVAMSAREASAQVHCHLEVDGHVYLDRVCNFDRWQGGSFSVEGGRYFAYVTIDDTNPDVASGSWNGGEGNHAHNPLGTLVRQGACWVNDYARVCARKMQ
jgi:hypothetical protein